VSGSPILIYDVETLEKIVSSLKEGNSLESTRKEFEPVATLDPLVGGSPLVWETSSSGAFLVRNIPINGIFELHAVGQSGQKKTIMVMSRPFRGLEFTPNDASPDKMQLQGSRIKLNFDKVIKQ